MLMTGAAVRAWRRGGMAGKCTEQRSTSWPCIRFCLFSFFEFQLVFLLDSPPVPVPLHAPAADQGSAHLRLRRVAQEIALTELHLRAPTIPAEQVRSPMCMFLDALQVCRKSFARSGRVLICWVLILCAASMPEAFRVFSFWGFHCRLW